MEEIIRGPSYQELRARTLKQTSEFGRDSNLSCKMMRQARPCRAQSKLNPNELFGPALIDGRTLIGMSMNEPELKNIKQSN